MHNKTIEKERERREKMSPFVFYNYGTVSVSLVTSFAPESYLQSVFTTLVTSDVYLPVDFVGPYWRVTVPSAPVSPEPLAVPPVGKVIVRSTVAPPTAALSESTIFTLVYIRLVAN